MKAIIIEDEDRNRIVLQSLVETYCPEVQIIGHADSVSRGIGLIHESNPELIFMDIRIVGGTGFDILDRLDELNAAIIFTTAYDQYALKAFKFSAIDYLLKPIDIDELKNAVKRAVNSDTGHLNNQKLQNLLSNLKQDPKEEPVMLVSTLDTIEFIKIRNIYRLEAQGSYTMIYLKEKKSLLASKVIKEYEFLLKDHAFYRVHQSHLINIESIDKYLKSDHCFQLTDGTLIQLARSRKEQFFEVLKHIGK
jgi:two-component system LytT family response regulator